MAKPRKYGMKSAYMPNAKADERRRKKAYEKGKAYADNDEVRKQRKELRSMQKGFKE